MLQMQIAVMGWFQLSAMHLPSPRRCRAYERDDFWWDHMWNNRYDEDYHGGNRWKRDFCMSVDMFVELVRKLTPTGGG